MAKWHEGDTVYTANTIPTGHVAVQRQDPGQMPYLIDNMEPAAYEAWRLEHPLAPIRL